MAVSVERSAVLAGQAAAAAARIAHNSFQVDVLGLIPPEGEFRQTPAGEPEVKDLVAIGAIVETNYGTGPYRVKRVDRHVWRGLASYSLVCEGVENGREGYLNEYVAVGGRLLHLFPSNHDEILLIESAGQLTLF
jgi:hypothetical protein